MDPVLRSRDASLFLSGQWHHAKVPKPGLFVKANGGTLFLDEVGELPITLAEDKEDIKD